jgi:SAM-dependent methyltransferase
MNQEIINKLKCLSCGSGFKISFVSPLIDKQIIKYGTVQCDCGEFPIIDGILVTRKYPKLQMINNVIKTARSILSLELTALNLIEEPYIHFLFRISLIIRKLFGKWPWLSFWKMVTFVKNSRYGTYLKYRFSCPSFISGMALIPVFKNVLANGGLFLDLGSGVGHFDFLLSRFVDANKLVCADKHFMNLYLAKNYLVGLDANYICLDADEQIPFKDGVFSAILSMDAFHYIENKQLLAKEFQRALKKDGVIFFVHLHNKYGENMSKGLPLSPEEYAGLFSDYKVRLFPEKSLVQNVFTDNGLDLGADSDPDAVNKSDAISMVITKESRYLKTYESYISIKPIPTSEDVILNPLFMKVGVNYVRRFPSDFYEEEYPLIKEFFPETIGVNTSIDELKRKLIMIPVPKNYLKKGERLYRFRLWR